MNQNSAAFEIISVKSGARSLRCCATGETFHPVVGPMIEARILHVRQQRLLERAAAANPAAPFVIWDVGLGAAANAIAVLEAFAAAAPALPRRIELHSFDSTLQPLEFALQHAQDLEYLVPYVGAARALIATGRAELSESLEWRLHFGDFRELIEEAALPTPEAILYDPYSAKSNPGMWTLEHFKQVRIRLGSDAPCMLTNYTRSTAVRVTLLLAGFFVGHGAGVGEKDQTTAAVNRLELLESPLDVAWLERVRASTCGAPLRARGEPGRIAKADWDALLAHPQFQEP